MISSFKRYSSSLICGGLYVILDFDVFLARHSRKTMAIPSNIKFQRTHQQHIEPDTEGEHSAEQLEANNLTTGSLYEGECPNISIPTWRRYTAVFTVSWITLAATFASTSILSVMPEIASDLSATVEIIGIINAGLLDNRRHIIRCQGFFYLDRYGCRSRPVN